MSQVHWKMNELSLEIIREILLHFPGYEAARLAQINTNWRAAFDSLPNSYWFIQVQRWFTETDPEAHPWIDVLKDYAVQATNYLLDGGQLPSSHGLANIHVDCWLHDKLKQFPLDWKKLYRYHFFTRRLASLCKPVHIHLLTGAGDVHTVEKLLPMVLFNPETYEKPLATFLAEDNSAPSLENEIEMRTFEFFGSRQQSQARIERLPPGRSPFIEAARMFQQQRQQALNEVANNPWDVDFNTGSANAVNLSLTDPQMAAHNWINVNDMDIMEEVNPILGRMPELPPTVFGQDEFGGFDTELSYSQMIRPDAHMNQPTPLMNPPRFLFDNPSPSMAPAISVIDVLDETHQQQNPPSDFDQFIDRVLLTIFPNFRPEQMVVSVGSNAWLDQINKCRCMWTLFREAQNWKVQVNPTVRRLHFDHTHLEYFIEWNDAIHGPFTGDYDLLAQKFVCMWVGFEPREFGVTGSPLLTGPFTSDFQISTENDLITYLNACETSIRQVWAELDRVSKGAQRVEVSIDTTHRTLYLMGVLVNDYDFVGLCGIQTGAAFRQTNDLNIHVPAVNGFSMGPPLPISPDAMNAL